VNQSLFVMPGWFSRPPASLRSAQEDRRFPAFWVPLQVGCGLAMLSALALNRKNERGPLLATAVGLYAATWISTGAYFAPEIMRLGKADGAISTAELGRRGKRWLGLTWLRHLALGAAWVLSLTAQARRP